MTRNRLLGLAVAVGLVASASPGSATPLIGDQTILLVTSAPVLIGAGLNVNPIAPTVVAPDIVGRPEAVFPITGGDVTGLSGTIEHSGGLSFDNGVNTLALSNFVIDLDAAQLLANAEVNGVPTGQDVLATVSQCTLLVGTADQCIDSDGSILLDGWKIRLNEGAGGAFEQLFGVAGIDGLQLGVARIDIRFVPEPGTAALVGMGLFAAALRGRRARANRA